MLISICIPTFNRNDLLEECVFSVFDNNTRPVEIIISDDSVDCLARDILTKIQPPKGITIKYYRNDRLKGQGGNTQNALIKASGDWISLMHDDDYFLPQAIDRLWAIAQLSLDVDLIFGKQQIVHNNGAHDEISSRVSDSIYFKTDAYLGLRDPLWAALVQQLPNNGWLARRSLLSKVQFPLETEVGRIPVDFHFGLRLALSTQNKFFFLEHCVSAYRLSKTSILRSPEPISEENGHLGFNVLAAVIPHTEEQKAALEIAKSRSSASAIRGYLANRRPYEAMELLLNYGSRMNISWLGKLRLLLATVISLAGLHKVALAVLRKTR